MTNLTPDLIFQVATGFMATKHLFAANEIGLFENLAEGPATLDELAQRTGIPRRTLRIVVDAMVALGFVDRQGDHYQNGPVAASFLSGRTPNDLRPVLHFFDRLNYPRWEKFEEAVRTGKAIFGELDFTKEEQEIYSKGVEAITAGGAHALATTYDFSQHQRVLDLGGGTGSFLLGVLRHHSGVEGTLFELPSTAAVARQLLAGNPLRDRIKIVEGNFFKDPVPTGHDAVIIADVVHLFSPERNLELLRRIREGVADGARLLLVDFWTNLTHTQPTFAALIAGQFLITTGEGDVYNQEEVSGWLWQTGWRPLEHKPLAGPASLIVAETAEL
jgi:hypothetical protein